MFGVRTSPRDWTQGTNESTEKSTNKSANKRTHKSINKNTNKRTNKSTNRSIKKSTNRSTALPVLKEKVKEAAASEVDLSVSMVGEPVRDYEDEFWEVTLQSLSSSRVR